MDVDSSGGSGRIGRAGRSITVSSALALLAALGWGGCASHPTTYTQLTTAPATQAPVLAASHPYVLHLPGIGGERSVDHWLISGLADAGLVGPMRIYDWTEHDPGLISLQAYQRNRDTAHQIAALITQQFRADPSRPIYLTCHSGGAGLAAWALEDLPADVYIDKWVMLAPALSPKYDLSPALRHVHGYAYSFNSLLDTLVLNAGTTLFGTIDGVKTPAAGYGGFVAPPGADPAQYKKLIQIQYEAAWLRYGNMGDHIGAMAPGFVQAVIAPLLMSVDPLPRVLEGRASTAPVR